MTRQVLELIDESLESFFRATVPLSATDVDCSFAAPDREWSAKLTRPTVNVFLWDIRRSATRSKAGMQSTTHNGQNAYRPALPALEMRYVVTAWTSDHGDERALLGGLIRAILVHSSIPREYLPPAFDELPTPGLAMARTGEDHMDVFKALEGQLKPGLNMVLSTDFDTGLFLPAGPRVEVIETVIGRMSGGGETRRRIAGEIVDADAKGAVGVIARSSVDATYVNARGQFLLRASVGEEIVVETQPALVAMVPTVGGVRFE